MIFQFRPLTAGGHVHVNVYVAPTIESTFAHVGKLIFHQHEYDAWLLLLARANASKAASPDNVITLVEEDDVVKEQRRYAEEQEKLRRKIKRGLEDVDPV